MQCPETTLSLRSHCLPSNLPISYAECSGGQLLYHCVLEMCTPEQYDMAIEHDPHSCRPFAALMGDIRRGSEMLTQDVRWDTWRGGPVTTPSAGRDFGAALSTDHTGCYCLATQAWARLFARGRSWER
mmetsp:Transcript_1998/g.4162  ORF Transcript_1998/g.4162 Transcript_1998/m.4162 type:complete len:128 (-) Transcript_1998:381-764(-)